MSDNSFDRVKSHKTVLSMTLKDVLLEYKDGMDLANKHGDICTTVSFANKINFVQEIINDFMDVDEETEGLITEEYSLANGIEKGIKAALKNAHSQKRE